MRVALHVNVDHVATLRNARGTRYPDPVEAAIAAERAGADGVTLHLREDRRHITERDVRVMREVVRGVFNLETAATADGLRVALETRPDHVTLVPERREERTTEGGLDVVTHREAIGVFTAKLQDAGVRVSLFVAPDEAQLDASALVGADQVELHTGDYANAVGGAVVNEIDALRLGAELAHARGLRLAAGHGLTTGNVGPIAALPHLVELNIGHAIVADAVIVGVAEAVRAMRDAIDRGSAER